MSRSKEHKVFVILLIIICFMLATLANADNEEDKEESFYEQISQGVIRLEHHEEIKQEGSNKAKSRNVSNGTAFFVRSGKSLYVVSARHVVEKGHNLHARVRCKNRETGNFELALLKLPRERWFFHPDEGDRDTNYVDVAAQKIHWIKDRRIRTFRYEPKDSKDFKKNQLPLEDATPPKKILVFGFPVDIGFKLLEQRPFGRSGIIAMVTGKEFLKLSPTKFAEERCSLIDADMFPGNSGSPIINQFSPSDPEPKLLGLVIASNLKLNFAVMEPVSRIREVLDLAKEQSTEGVNNWFLREP